MNVLELGMKRLVINNIMKYYNGTIKRNGGMDQGKKPHESFATIYHIINAIFHGNCYEGRGS